MYHQKLKDGSPREIESMVRGVLTERGKRGGRMELLGYAVAGTPMSNLDAMYRAGVKYGRVPR